MTMIVGNEVDGGDDGGGSGPRLLVRNTGKWRRQLFHRFPRNNSSARCGGVLIVYGKGKIHKMCRAGFLGQFQHCITLLGKTCLL
ncbi:hypothetical protein KPH14_007629 [Odynerus spinipes]|uniref:Uncharacterized protein n=1 Tax=Odynerus spinipes TaxID=1348599 RepID=A0AAD9VMJ8_9HYME|nr:hypothetical protein KPH14_007629 [Odynerus spinipes]